MVYVAVITVCRRRPCLARSAKPRIITKQFLWRNRRPPEPRTKRLEVGRIAATASFTSIRIGRSGVPAHPPPEVSVAKQRPRSLVRSPPLKTTVDESESRHYRPTCAHRSVATWFPRFKPWWRAPRAKLLRRRRESKSRGFGSRK